MLSEGLWDVETIVYFCLVKSWFDEIEIKILLLDPGSQSNTLNTVSPEFPIPFFTKARCPRSKPASHYSLYILLCVFYFPLLDI